MKELERLKFCIERFDHYFDSVNNKNNILLGFTTFIVGGLVALYPSFIEKVNITLCLQTIYFITIGLGVLSMLLMIIAATPFLKSENISIFYFGSISKMSKEDFLQMSENQTLSNQLIDMREQAFVLAKGLYKKFLMIRIACIFITIQFILFIPFIILLTINLKQ
jgi:hypothetical protein